MYVTKVDDKLDVVDNEKELKEVLSKYMNNVEISIIDDNLIKLKSGEGVKTTNIVILQMINNSTVQVNCVNVDISENELFDEWTGTFTDLRDITYISFALLSSVSYDKCDVLEQLYKSQISHKKELQNSKYRITSNNTITNTNETNYNIASGVFQKKDIIDSDRIGEKEIIINKGIEIGIIPDEKYNFDVTNRVNDEDEKFNSIINKEYTAIAKNVGYYYTLLEIDEIK